MRTTFDHRGNPVAFSKTKDRWHIRAGGHVYTARFLDDALSAALPSLTHRERDDLVVSLLERESRGS
jgi:hypothetical protein